METRKLLTDSQILLLIAILESQLKIKEAVINKLNTLNGGSVQYHIVGAEIVEINKQLATLKKPENGKY